MQLTAEAQTSPPAITLRWLRDSINGASGYNVYRKNKDAGSWNHIAGLSGTTYSYTDYNVGVGAAYEYQVVKSGNPTAYGYIYAGIRAPFAEHRGKIILVVDASVASPLSTELTRLRSDLIGDGWTVVRRDVGRNDSPANVRNIIVSEYYADPGRVRAVFLFGHIPILRSGNLNVDGHQARPMPADSFYGEMDGGWNNHSHLPSDVELMVGRVDLWNMPGEYSSSPWPSEVELLRNYLRKDHAWRHKRYTAPQRAVLGNRFGDFGGEAFAASGFRNFDPLVGAGRTEIASELNEAQGWERWASKLAGGSYLWAYGCGAGSYTSMSFMGTHGPYSEAWSYDLVDQDAKAVFFMMFGSWLGEWDTRDNIMRAALATPSMGLACAWSGRPHWYFHHMAMGEPIGLSARLSMNNNGLYRNQVNGDARGVHIALMGDPTLRMHQVAPPSNVSARSANGNTQITWSPSSDGVIGYHVYRANTINGPYDRVSGAHVAGTSFIDSASGNYAYMVRALQLENTPSGSYFNLSQGAFATSSTDGGGGDGGGGGGGGTDTQPPSITIAAPGAGANVSGTILLRANASDNVRVAGVQFRIDGLNAGPELWVPPYELNWDSTKSTVGAHSITAVARDNEGNRTVAGPVVVNVSGGVKGGTWIERVWFEDTLPNGAEAFGNGEGWDWITSRKYSGTRAHRSAQAGGLHEHWFDSADEKMTVNTGNKLFTYVYLDPTATPRQIMLQWSDGSWEHRAYWGESLIGMGTEGTDSRRYMGPLPPAGQWFRLKVPANLVGLQGKQVQGMAFTVWGGRATWDRAGKMIQR